MCKIENPPSRAKFFQGKELYFKNFDINKKCKNKI